MPVITVLTKADILELYAIGQLRDEQGLSMKEAKPKAPAVASQMLSKLRREVENELIGSKYPPKIMYPCQVGHWESCITIILMKMGSCRHE